MVRLRNPKAYKRRGKSEAYQSLRIPLNQLKKRNASQATRKRNTPPAGGK